MFKMSRKTCGKSLLVTKKNFLWKKIFRNIWWELFFPFSKIFYRKFYSYIRKIIVNTQSMDIYLRLINNFELFEMIDHSRRLHKNEENRENGHFWKNEIFVKQFAWRKIDKTPTCYTSLESSQSVLFDSKVINAYFYWKILKISKNRFLHKNFDFSNDDQAPKKLTLSKNNDIFSYIFYSRKI